MAKRLDLEEAAEKFGRLLNSGVVTQLHEANEAKTRLLLIDEVLEILGWQKAEYDPEHATATNSFTDYRLHIDGVPRLIVEAKRFGQVEGLPQNIRKREYANKFLVNSCGHDMQALLKQCLSYCTECGVPYALATTGEIWVVLIGFKHGVEWGQLRSYVFHNLQDVYEHFGEFYGLVSRESVRNNSLESKFQGMTVIRPTHALQPRKLVNSVPEIGEVPNKSIIELYFDQFMGDLTRSEQAEMLQQCYVENRSLNEFSRDLRHLLQYDAGLDEHDSQDSPIETIDEEELHEQLDLQLSATSPRTILVVGNIGVGKSTFIQRFRRYEPDTGRTSGKTVCTVINLINEANVTIHDGRSEQQMLANLVLEALAREFRKEMDPFEPDVMKRAFESEIARFRSMHRLLYQQDRARYLLTEEEHIANLSNDKYLHLRRYIRFARSHGYRTWLAFDNVDRGSDSYQEFVYTFAHKLSADARCVTLITLREDTYLEARARGFLDVRTTDKVFRITAPEFRQVVSKRRKYVDRLINAGTLSKPLKQHSSLLQLLNCHLTHLILGDDASVRLLVTSFSMNNVRYGLSLIRDYYLSSHATFHEFYTRHKENLQDAQLVRFDPSTELDRFIQALMLENSWSYREDLTEVFNLFAVNPYEQTSHFMALRLLAYLDIERSTVGSRISVKYEKLLGDFASLGYQYHHVEDALRRLLNAGLAVSPTLPVRFGTETGREAPNPLPHEVKVAVSAKGAYFLKTIASNHYYQARVAEDTIWYDEELARLYAQSLQDCANSQTSKGALDLIQATNARETFLQYLRRSLIDESHDRSQHYASRPWANHVDDVVERAVFGERVTKGTLLAEVDNTIEGEVRTGGPGHGKRSEASKWGLGKAAVDPMQLRLPSLGDSGATQALADAAQSLGRLPKDLKYKESLYIVRVLWALEVASRAGMGYLHASDVAKLVREVGKVNVEETNVARFFRAQKRNGVFVHLWTEDKSQRYAINATGRSLLTRLLKSRRTAKPVKTRV